MSMAAVQKNNRFLDYDGWLLFPVLFLVGIGIVMVYSASSALALKKFGSDIYFLKKQGLFALLVSADWWPVGTYPSMSTG